MKHYFKNYYKTRITEGVIESEAYKTQMVNAALAKHENIMEGFNPDGRSLGFITPDSRAEYIKHFTSFIKEQFNIQDISWKEAKILHKRLVQESSNDETAKAYLGRFSDFMNTPSTKIIIENADVYLKPSPEKLIWSNKKPPERGVFVLYEISKL